MTLEVELKFHLADPQPVLAELERLGAVRGAPQRQVDRYFAHPSRDFAQTNEALRIRSIGDANFITYKGPVLDAATKMRREIELPLGRGGETREQMAEVFAVLGFREVAAVEKVRTPYHLRWNDRELEAAFDDVAGLGQFLEIETLAEEADRDAARDLVLELARRLRLENPERKSYLSLILKTRETSA